MTVVGHMYDCRCNQCIATDWPEAVREYEEDGRDLTEKGVRAYADAAIAALKEMVEETAIASAGLFIRAEKAEAEVASWVSECNMARSAQKDAEAEVERLKWMLGTVAEESCLSDWQLADLAARYENK